MRRPACIPLWALVVCPERINMALAASSTKASAKVLFNPFANPNKMVNNKIAKVTVNPDSKLRVRFLLIL